jgi:[ribosomal protein S18]-alanine N-acetyltransferase
VVTKVAFRTMALTDLSAVLCNEKSAYSHPWSEGIFRDCLNQKGESWVLITGDLIAGHGLLSIGAGEAHLLNVCVNAQLQGQGLGRKLTVHMLSQAKRRRAKSLFLEVRPSNMAARSLYDSLGFNEIGRRKGYYPGVTKREDALVMAKELI